MTVELLASFSRVGWEAPPTEMAERPLRVMIDVSALAEADAPHIERFTLERVEPLLQERVYTRDDDARDAIEIRFEYLDPEDLEYAVHVDVYADGALVEPGIEWFVCQFCPQMMLADTVARHLPAALDVLERAEAEAVASVPPEGDSQATAAPTEPGDEPPARRRSLGVLGIEGAIAAGGGLATTITGIVLVARGRVVEPSDTPHLRAVNYRPVGLALLGVGAGAAALGAAAIVVDVVRRKKNKGIAIAPSWVSRGAGVSMSVRF
jgi:hypothetical protein